jgi:hypothetical protein
MECWRDVKDTTEDYGRGSRRGKQKRQAGPNSKGRQPSTASSPSVIVVCNDRRSSQVSAEREAPIRPSRLLELLDSLCVREGEGDG